MAFQGIPDTTQREYERNVALGERYPFPAAPWLAPASLDAGVASGSMTLALDARQLIIAV